MLKKLARIRPTRGLAADVPSWEVAPDFYSRLQNVVVRHGFPHRVRGKRLAYDPPSIAPLHLQNVRIGGNNFWVYYGASSIYAVEGATQTDLSPVGLSAVTKPSQWISTRLNGIPCVTNTLDAPMYWDGNVLNNFAPLVDWPASTLAKFIVAFKYHLFALNITVGGTNNPHLLMWSDATDPGDIPQSWTPAPANEAGSVEISARGGDLMCADILRDALVIYKSSSAHLVDYVGGSEKFSFRGLWDRAGAISPRAVASKDGNHIVVTDSDIVLNDGFSPPVSIGSGLINEFLFTHLDQTNYEALQCFYDPSNRELWIAFPEVGSSYCTTALVYNFASNAWGVIELPTVAHIASGIVDDQAESLAWDDDDGNWDDDFSSWDETNIAVANESTLLAVPGTPAIYLFDTDDLVSYDALLARYGLTFGEPERVKLVRSVHVRGSGFGTLYVRVGAQMTPEGGTTWSAEVAVTSPEQKVNLFAQGRYISIEIRSEDTNIWTVTGFDFEIEVRGYF